MTFGPRTSNSPIWSSDRKRRRVLFRSPNVIPGYWNNPEATESALGGFGIVPIARNDVRSAHEQLADLVIRSEAPSCALPISERHSGLLEQSRSHRKRSRWLRDCSNSPE